MPNNIRKQKKKAIPHCFLKGYNKSNASVSQMLFMAAYEKRIKDLSRKNQRLAVKLQFFRLENARLNKELSDQKKNNRQMMFERTKFSAIISKFVSDISEVNYLDSDWAANDDHKECEKGIFKVPDIFITESANCLVATEDDNSKNVNKQRFLSPYVDFVKYNRRSSSTSSRRESRIFHFQDQTCFLNDDMDLTPESQAFEQRNSVKNAATSSSDPEKDSVMIHSLPVQVRDYAINEADDIPKSEVNREYYSQNMEREVANTDGSQPFGALAKAQNSGDLLMKLARTTPYYKRNHPHICSFWVKGECKRGEECLHRHEKSGDDPLADQNIKDRFYGANDPVADKLLRREAAMPKLEPPEDKTITTLHVGNLGDKITEKELRDHFYQYGEIRSITLQTEQQCAFIQFITRAAAELSAEKAFNELILCGRRLTIKWYNSQAKGNSNGLEDSEPKNLEPVPGLPDRKPKKFEELPRRVLPPRRTRAIINYKEPSRLQKLRK